MQNLEQITEQALDAIARAEDGKALDAIRVEYFGKRDLYGINARIT